MSGWHRFHSGHTRRRLVIRRQFSREAKLESRTFCPCEECRLRFGRMLFNRHKSGDPLRSYDRHPRRHPYCSPYAS